MASQRIDLLATLPHDAATQFWPSGNMIDEKRQKLSTLYSQFGFEARKILMTEYAAENIALTRIRREDVEATLQWDNRKVSWDWELLVRNARNQPRRIDLAIQQQNQLCGLALGKVTNGRMYARIDRLERAPGENALEGLVGEIATRYLEVVGGIAGCRETVIVAPAEGLIDFYGNLGYVDRINLGGKLWGLKRTLPQLALRVD